MKSFLISIDTEGDNLWEWKKGNEITTRNAGFLERFQNLCNEFGFKPTYLTNYEMAKSQEFVKFVKKPLASNEAEIGMHLHAWNTPPDFDLSSQNPNPGAPYLIEYPYEVMDQKISTMTNLLESVFERKIETHRAGRWATDERYFELLYKHGFSFDCSITPHVNWSSKPGESLGSHGSDYTKEYDRVHVLIEGQKPLYEIPCTVKVSHRFFKPYKSSLRGLAGSFYRQIIGDYVWLRPDGYNLDKMLWILDSVNEDKKIDYVMFMLHSSELMPGGSPTFRTAESIEHLYQDMRKVFIEASKKFEGKTICEYGRSL